MKLSIILILFSFLTSFSFCQSEINNFKIENDHTVWQKVFDTNNSFEQILKYFTNNGILLTYSVSDTNITGELKKLKANYKESGISKLSIPIYLSQMSISGFILIEYKPNKYRITVKEMVFIQDYDTGLYKQGEITNLDDVALSKDKRFKNQFSNITSGVIDKEFIETFTIKETNTNW